MVNARNDKETAAIFLSGRFLCLVIISAHAILVLASVVVRCRGNPPSLAVVLLVIIVIIHAALATLFPDVPTAAHVG